MRHLLHRLSLILVIVALCACGPWVQVRESSGLAGSAQGFWTLNDGRNVDGSGGESALFEWKDGRVVRRVEVAAPNRDWEDLDRFRMKGTSYLLIADVGDNGAVRDQVQLYLVREPAAGETAAVPVGTVRFRYPGGPRDAEAVAVIPGTWRAVVISKREHPPAVFEVDLTRRNGVQEAQRLATLAALPAPTWSAKLMFPWVGRYSDQPTGLDISDDGALAVVSTYDSAYLFRKAPDEAWSAAFGRPPQRVELPGMAVYEGITVEAGVIHVSREGADGVIAVPLPTGTVEASAAQGPGGKAVSAVP